MYLESNSKLPGSYRKRTIQGLGNYWKGTGNYMEVTETNWHNTKKLGIYKENTDKLQEKYWVSVGKVPGKYRESNMKSIQLRKMKEPEK